jgi:hypothetical protein
MYFLPVRSDSSTVDRVGLTCRFNPKPVDYSLRRYRKCFARRYVMSCPSVLRRRLPVVLVAVTDRERAVGARHTVVVGRLDGQIRRTPTRGHLMHDRSSGSRNPASAPTRPPTTSTEVSSTADIPANAFASVHIARSSAASAAGGPEASVDPRCRGTRGLLDPPLGRQQRHDRGLRGSQADPSSSSPLASHPTTFPD